MKRAGMNTLMGMGTVFAVLILISVLIYALGFIGRRQNKKQMQLSPAPEKISGSGAGQAFTGGRSVR